MKVNLTTSLKMLFCIILIAGWSFHFINIPDKNKKYKLLKHKSIQKKEPKTVLNEIKQEKLPLKKTEEIKETEKTEKLLQLKKIQMPVLKTKPVENKKSDMAPVKQDVISDKSKQANEIVKIETETIENKPIDSKKIANATLEAITKEIKNEMPADSTKLREEIKVDKQKLKPVIQKINELQNESLQNSWLPKVQEELVQASLAEQIEVTDIVSKPTGENNIIIKNKLNNYLGSLGIGESYQSLRLIKIIGSEVYFKDTILNMVYKKNLTPN